MNYNLTESVEEVAAPGQAEVDDARQRLAGLKGK